jgi:hypothetical protein
VSLTVAVRHKADADGSVLGSVLIAGEIEGFLSLSIVGGFVASGMEAFAAKQCLPS